jgi:hypothetical protein
MLRYRITARLSAILTLALQRGNLSSPVMFWQNDAVHLQPVNAYIDIGSMGRPGHVAIRNAAAALFSSLAVTDGTLRLHKTTVPVEPDSGARAKSPFGSRELDIVQKRRQMDPSIFPMRMFTGPFSSSAICRATK